MFTVHCPVLAAVRAASVCVAFLSMTGATAAQAPAASAPPTVLRAARLLDVRGGRIVQGAVVVVQDGRIASIGGAVPAGATVIDLGDVTLSPGLIDLHSHLAYDIEGNWVMRGVTETSVDAAFRAARNARRTVEAGFTTVRDLGSADFVDVKLMRAIDAGFVTGPRIVGAGHSLGVTGGHCDTTGLAPGLQERDWRSGIADGVDDVTRAVRYQIKHGARVIKVCATAGVLSFESSVGAQQLTEAELKAAVEEAARHDMRVAAHAHGAAGIKAAVRAGVISIEHGSMLDDEGIDLMKSRGTYLVPTSHLVDAINMDALPPAIRAKAESVLPVARENLKKAIARGVKIGFGTDAAVYPHGDNAKELAVYTKLGMPAIDAVRTATTVAAEVLGVTDRGAIEPGLLADVIAIAGNPLEDVRAYQDVRFVMVGGKVLLKK